MMRIAFILLIGSIVGITIGFAQESDESVTNVVPDQFIVGLNSQVAIEEWCLKLERKGIDMVAPVELLSKSLNIWLVQAEDSAMGMKDRLSLLSRQFGSDIVQFNHTGIVVRNTPNDPGFEDQWAFHNDGNNGGSGTADIDALSAWDISTGGVTATGDTIVVAIIDDGFKIDHPDLAPNLFKNHHEIPGNGLDDDGNGYVDDVHGWNSYGQNGTVTVSNHGTHVSGTVGARGNNGIGVTGVNWNVKILPISGSSTLESTVVSAYAYVLEMRRLYNETQGERGAYIVATNASFGVDYGDPAEYPIWCAMYDSLGMEGVLSMGATANLNINIDVAGDVPTACGSNFLISVTNTTSSDVRNSGAAYGVTTIDIGAPGTGIYSTTVNDGYGYLSGTSMATPHVTGAIALMYSAMCPEVLESYPSNPAGLAFHVRSMLLNDGVDQITALQGMVSSGGRLNLFNAVRSVSDTCMRIFFETEASSCGSCDGTIEAEVIGGAAPLQYHWSTGDTTSLLTSKCAGHYVLTVVDAEGDSAVADIALSDSLGPILGVVLTDVTCPGAVDGSLTLTGGAAYAWADGSMDSVRTGLQAGTYIVTATDSSGNCQRVEILEVDEPLPLDLEVQQDLPSPYTASNGSLTAEANGGTPPYSYQWSTGGVQDSEGNLSVGDYSLTVTDANGCTAEFDTRLGYPIGVADVHSEAFRLYPNPASTSLHMEKLGANPAQFYVLDVLGRMVLEGKVTSDFHTVDLSGVPSGVYIMKVSIADGLYTNKFEVRR